MSNATCLATLKISNPEAGGQFRGIMLLIRANTLTTVADCLGVITTGVPQTPL